MPLGPPGMFGARLRNTGRGGEGLIDDKGEYEAQAAARRMDSLCVMDSLSKTQPHEDLMCGGVRKCEGLKRGN